MYNKNLVFTASCIGMLLFGISLTTLGSILPDIAAAHHLNEVAKGGLISILPFSVLIGSLIFGPIVDRYGYKMMIILCSFLVGLALIGLSLANTFIFLQASIALIGFGGGVLNGGTNALVSDLTEEHKGASLNLLGVFFGVGALGIPLVLGLLSVYGYHAILGIIGGAIILVSILLLLVKFPLPKNPQGFPLSHGISLIKNPLLILLSFILFIESGLEALMSNWTTSYMMNYIQIVKEQALFVLTLHVLGLTLGRLALSFILKKVSEKKVLYFSLVLILAACIIMMNVRTYTAVIAGVIILGFGFAAIFPTVLGFVGQAFSKLSGTAFSIALVIALFGNMLINYIMGLLSQSFGISVLPKYMAVCMIIMAFLLTIYYVNFNKKESLKAIN